MAPDSALRGGRILVVDDTPMNRQYLRALLSGSGYQTLEAGDAGEALRLMRAGPIDLVISDILMPVMDGYELVCEMRSDPELKDIPVIFFTSHYMEQEAWSLARACGVTSLISKPGELKVILSTVEAALKRGVTHSGSSSQTVIERDHRHLLATKLAQIVAQLEAANTRLSSLLELGQKLVLERDPMEVLTTYCDAAREIIGARYAAVGIVDEATGDLGGFRATGPAGSCETSSPPPLQGVLSKLRAGTCPLRLRDLDIDPATLGFKAGRDRLRSFLGVPIRSAGRLNGLLYLADRNYAEEFTVEDEGVALMISSQFAVVHENARLYSRLQIRTQELNRSNQELEQFAFLVSHDLEEPLRMVASYTELLEKRIRDSLDSDSRQFIAFASEGARRALSLIRELLAYSRLGGGGTAPATVDPAALLAQVVADLRTVIEDTGATVAWDSLPVVIADPLQLRQLLQNLIGNGIKFHRAGEPVRVHISAHRQGDEWVFHVRDNGIGIDPGHIKRLFVMFQRLHGREKYDGTGLGLAICRKIVENHGGRIWIESEPGIGSVFKFTLPHTPG